MWSINTNVASQANVRECVQAALTLECVGVLSWAFITRNSGRRLPSTRVSRFYRAKLRTQSFIENGHTGFQIFRLLQLDSACSAPRLSDAQAALAGSGWGGTGRVRRPCRVTPRSFLNCATAQGTATNEI